MQYFMLPAALMTASGMLANAAPVSSGASASQKGAQGLEPMAPSATRPGEPLVVSWGPASGNSDWKHMNVSLVALSENGKNRVTHLATDIDGTDAKNNTLRTKAPKHLGNSDSTNYVIRFTDGKEHKDSPKFTIEHKNHTYSKLSARHGDSHSSASSSASDADSNGASSIDSSDISAIIQQMLSSGHAAGGRSAAAAKAGGDDVEQSGADGLEDEEEQEDDGATKVMSSSSSSSSSSKEHLPTPVTIDGVMYVPMVGSSLPSNLPTSGLGLAKSNSTTGDGSSSSKSRHHAKQTHKPDSRDAWSDIAQSMDAAEAKHRHHGKSSSSSSGETDSNMMGVRNAAVSMPSTSKNHRHNGKSTSTTSPSSSSKSHHHKHSNSHGSGSAHGRNAAASTSGRPSSSSSSKKHKGHHGGQQKLHSSTTGASSSHESKSSSAPGSSSASSQSSSNNGSSSSGSNSSSSSASPSGGAPAGKNAAASGGSSQGGGSDSPSGGNGGGGPTGGEMTVATPPYAAQCQPLKITWKGGEPPFRPKITADGDVSNVLSLLDETSDTGLTWKVNVAEGQKFTISVCDATGQCQASAPVGPVGKGPGDCLNGDGAQKRSFVKRGGTTGSWDDETSSSSSSSGRNHNTRTKSSSSSSSPSASSSSTSAINLNRLTSLTSVPSAAASSILSSLPSVSFFRGMDPLAGLGSLFSRESGSLSSTSSSPMASRSMTRSRAAPTSTSSRRRHHGTQSASQGSSEALDGQVTRSLHDEQSNGRDQDLMDVLAQGIMGDSGLSPGQISEYFHSSGHLTSDHQRHGQMSMTVDYHRGTQSVSMSS